MSKKLINIDDISNHIKDGMTIMVSGFMGCGSPHKIIDKLCELKVKDLTLICNDTGLIDYGVGKMVVNKQFKKILASHIGLNKESIRQLNENETEFELIPQGTLAEKIRSGGAGLGGVLTPTGVGTIIEEGKSKIVIDDVEYIIEKPLKADIAIIGASKVDKKGNCYYSGSGRNFAPVMATAADMIIVEADEVVEVGDIKPEVVITPHIFVDYIVNGGNLNG
ncbi:3-oxoacid CoA-transferase subunit A [Romboutsia sp.]|uniref:CoA transferase subunit A n=1 Tax=Romboutsia sp. TaxID=1965302 RepID=UPI002B9BD4D2|nr:3-oxoacid CoA-transferase subunit A [Romboutsia sp.]HSQ89837.1 3-oxoacid CoA-transferase subunit A [Romboutsia sp.]